MRATIEQVIKESMSLCYQDTSMALDCICETLCYVHGIDATWGGRSIYVGDERIASIETCKEGKDIVAIWRYKMIGGKK